MKTILFTLLVLTANIAFAQRTVTGVITNKANQPIEGVKVSVKFTDVKTFTDAEGKYSIEVPEGAKNLEFTKTDFKTSAVEISGHEVNLTMTSLADVDIFELTMEELMNLNVVSSTKLAQKQSLAPSVISIVNKSAIHDYNWNSINDVLYKQAGFFPSQDFEKATVGSRGISEGWHNNHLLLMVDGLPFNQSFYGKAPTNEATPLIFTKSIEIIKGPGSALYGTNATNGVVTINTISASDFDKNKLFASIKYGEQNTMFYDALATFKTKLVDVTTSLSYNATDGEQYQSYDGSLEIDPNTNTLKRLETNNGWKNGYFFLKLEGKEKIKGLSLQLHTQLTDVETGHGWLWNIPDKEEIIRDTYNNLILKYQKDITPSIHGEIAVNYSHHKIDYDMWYYRTGAFGNFYPDGVNEVMKTSTDNVFTRLQFMFKLPKSSVILIATEPSVFMYSGDKEHYSNADLADAANGYPPFGENRPLGLIFEKIENKPVKNIGSFAQFSSGELLGKFVQITTGLRHDIKFFDYLQIDIPSKPVNSKTYSELSPRLSIVVAPTEKLSFKLLGMTAFRAPGPSEIFGSNNWIFVSNTEQLEPERIKSFEFAVDYSLSSYVNLRMNAFHTTTEGIIGYSIGNNNLLTNMYDLTNAGLESEILFIKDRFSAFANIAYVKRMDEKIFENELPYVSEHKDKLTWTPAFTANIGCTQHYKSFTFSLQGHYQDKVLRRDKDLYSAGELTALGMTTQPRPSEVKSWISINAQVMYKYKFGEFGISANNILNSDNYLIKNLKYPFDYKMEGRRISFVLNIEI